MDCKKAWELMMTRLDGEIDRRDLFLLENHLRVCPKCRKRDASLGAVMLELDRTKPAAPESTERKVMEKICRARSNETASVLPYVVLPAALLAGILAIWLYQFFMAGPIVMIDKATQVLTLFYEACRSVLAASHFLLSSVYLEGILIITGFSLLVGILALASAQMRKRVDEKAYWRSVK